MTYETTPGREPIVIVEIEQDLCGLTYGVSPCMASATNKCYKTLATCRSPESFAKGDPLRLRFTYPRDDLSRVSETLIPSLVSVSTYPAKLNVGAGDRNISPLGVRASVSVVLQDHPYHDRLTDPHYADRTAEPQGTFWGRWKARNPYYAGRLMHIYEGYIGQALAEMQKRTYVIEKLAGPDGAGKVSIKGLDILRKTDDTKAQAPAQSEGVLIADITNSDASFTIDPAGEGDKYPAAGLVRIGSEIIEYTRVDDVFTVVERGARNTEAAAHKQDDSVQACLEYDDERVDAIIYDLLVNYAGIPATMIDYDAWQDEADVWLAGQGLTAVIAEPTGVAKLLAELSEQGRAYIWWDEYSQLVRFSAIRPPSNIAGETVQILTDNENLIADSVAVNDAADQRLSRIIIRYAAVDPTKRVDDATNYSRIRVIADLEAEGENQYGESKTKIINARWLAADAAADTVIIGTRILSRYRNNPETVDIAVDAKDREISIADTIDIITAGITDETGAPFRRRYQVIEAEEIDPGHRMRYTVQRSFFSVDARYGGFMRDDAPVYAYASDEDKAIGAYFVDEATLLFPDGTGPYRFA